MISIGGLTGFWIITVVTFHGANMEDTKRNVLHEPDVPFPPARPTALNLFAICHHGEGRPRYPDSFFPRSGFSYLRRRGNAVNSLESWFALCCSGQVAQSSSQILCCTQQAWIHALSQFCMDEFSTKTLPYKCCEKKGDARWMCFDSDVPNPNYNPTPGYRAPPVPQGPGFTFVANAC